MNKSIFKSLYFLIILVFLIFIFISYFSDENVKKILKNRYSTSTSINNAMNNLPILENNTNNIIEYNHESSDDNKVKKRFFWNLLNNKNE